MNPKDSRLIYRAIGIIEALAVQEPVFLSSPSTVKDYLRLKLGHLDREEFHVILLNTQNGLISSHCVSIGTLTQCSVYPREVVKLALLNNASAVIFAHNHPSGAPEPSTADEMLTTQLKNALTLVDVRVLDHMVVTPTKVTSFAERGLI